MNPGLPCPSDAFVPPRVEACVAWAVAAVLLLWLVAGIGGMLLSSDRHGIGFSAADPAPHPGGRFDMAITAAEADPEPGRSVPPRLASGATAALRPPAAARTHVLVEALAFHAQRPRRPRGQAPPHTP